MRGFLFVVLLLVVSVAANVNVQDNTFEVPELKNPSAKQTPGVSCGLQTNEEVCNAISFCGWCQGTCQHGQVSPCALKAKTNTGSTKAGFIAGSNRMVTAEMASDGLDGHVVVQAEAVSSLPTSSEEEAEAVASEASPEDGSQEDSTHFETKDQMEEHDRQVKKAIAEERDEDEESTESEGERSDIAALEQRLEKIQQRIDHHHHHHHEEAEEEEKKEEEADEKKVDALDDVRNHVTARIEDKVNKEEAKVAAGETPIEALRRKVTALEEKFDSHHKSTTEEKAAEDEEKDVEEKKEEERKASEEEKAEEASQNDADKEDTAAAEAAKDEPSTKEEEHEITDEQVRENIRRHLAGESVEPWSDSVEPINYTEESDSTQEDGDDVDNTPESKSEEEEQEEQSESASESEQASHELVKKIIEEAKAGVPERVIEEEVEAEKKNEKEGESSEQLLKEDDGEEEEEEGEESPEEEAKKVIEEEEAKHGNEEKEEEEKEDKFAVLEKRMEALEEKVASMHPAQEKEARFREQNKVRQFFNKVLRHKK